MEPAQPRTTLWHQPALFDGGYHHVRVEFTCYVDGQHDSAQVNYVVTDAETGEWIGAEVPLTHLRLSDPTTAGAVVLAVLNAAQRLCDPF